MTRVKLLTKQLENLQTECDFLRKENELLKQKLACRGNKENVYKLPEARSPKTASPSHTISAVLPPASISIHSSTDDKITLFRSLFKGRMDVFPVLWIAKDGRQGYSPACKNEWDRIYCNKKKTKCSQCPNRSFIPVSDQIIFDHLSGKHIIGIYPLLEDETCWFLAIDFDKGDWQFDIAAFLETCQTYHIPTAIERSRSGNGVHIWIFFEDRVSAALARKLGFALLTLTMDKRHQIGLKSYDRFFPNQDTMPKGGFGNLIALPLQKLPREQGNTIFLDHDLQPYKDQWAYLTSIKKISHKELVEKVREVVALSQAISPITSSPEDSSESNPWACPPSGDGKESSIAGPLPESVRLIQANMLYIQKEGVPPALQNRILRIAAFPNPEFYKAQAMRLSTYGKPPIISCAEEHPQYLVLPRGCFDDVRQLLKEHDIDLQIEDERFRGKPVKVKFVGKLRKIQSEAVKNIRQHEIGILSAATAFGKTVVAAKMIAVRKRNTLILVHRCQLLDQWREKLALFLSIPQEDIGVIGGGKRKPTKIIDIGILQSLNRKRVVDDIVAESTGTSSLMNAIILLLTLTNR